MAQATVELPDPLEALEADGMPGLPTVENADDLLAQMAGQEIDRLLAEADGDPAPIRSHKPVIAPAVEPEPASIQATPAPIEPDKAVVNPPVEAEVEATIPAVKAAQPSAADSLATEDLNAVLATASAERAALHGNPAPASPLGPLASAVEGSLKGQSDEIDLAPDPWWGVLLRPLIWINVPLDAWPDAVRDAIGKVAVITTINSVAVIAYVLIFRRHHH